MTYQQLVSYLSEKGLAVSEKQCEALSRYAALLKEWNEKINLTSIVEEPEVIEKHFLDSALAAVDYSFAGRKVIDIGSGAGFPGAVIALLFPTSSVTLLDATKKKFLFLQAVKDDLHLENLHFLAGRVEDLKDQRESFDVAISRGFAAMRVFAEVGAPLIYVTGTLIAMKGPNGDAEMEEAKNILKKLSLRQKKKSEFVLPSGDRRIVYYFAKDAATPKRFPRRWDEIQRNKI
ncbi:MAG: 16S rRNA (guanine(527)-N(7))-methyltransferase RsmG [Bacilli bacterium]|nr:16S rRNA (guanine(527)-N(7))-methyltransferase RsmG [Bacilli bacterium]